MSASKISFDSGQKYPYDAGVVEVDWAHRAARGIVNDLMDRRGIKRSFEEIQGADDTDTMNEIVATIAEIIRIADKEREYG